MSDDDDLNERLQKFSQNACCSWVCASTKDF
jgi:hypothetical protein